MQVKLEKHITVVMTMSVEEAKILGDALVGYPASHASDPIWNALNAALEEVAE